MQRVVGFYEKLPRGPAPEVKAKGILGRYQAKHFGKNPTVKREFFEALQMRTGADKYLSAIIHALILVMAVGYAQTYYFHLRQ